MRICKSFRAVLVAALIIRAAPARAQLYESVGTRAQGMGGAFVAVADDASAGWWNPAGLASGTYFNVLTEKGRLSLPGDPQPGAPALRAGTSGFAAAFPALGLSYYRLQLSQLAPIGTADGGGVTRQEPVGGSRVRTLVVNQFGVTVGQSVGDHLVVGSTLKVLRGGVASGGVTDSGNPLDQADALDVRRRTRADLDLGVMATMGRVRLGATVRNATRPRFGEGTEMVTLVRQARTGVAVLSKAFSGFDAVTVAADADLTSTPTLFGDVRHAATGGEAWLLKRRLGFRAGVTTNTVGARRTATSTGVSVAPISGMFLEGSRTTGADDSLSGWTTTIRLTF